MDRMPRIATAVGLRDGIIIQALKGTCYDAPNRRVAILEKPVLDSAIHPNELGIRQVD